MIYCVDFDDLCDQVADRSLALLTALKSANPNLKVTLFTIPNRTSISTIVKYKQYPWIALAPHGWEHTRGECLSWTKDEAEEKIIAARSIGIDAPCFRAPGWLIGGDVYEACKSLDYVVCDHMKYRLNVDGARIYTYNGIKGRAPKTRAVHGHITKCNTDNYIEDMIKDGRLKFHQQAQFAFPWEVSTTLVVQNEEEKEEDC